MLTALALTSAQWAQIARQGSWQMVRQNLNTFTRQGVFELPGLAEAVAAKLSDAQAVARARVMPYQLLSAFKAAGPEKSYNADRVHITPRTRKRIMRMP